MRIQTGFEIVYDCPAPTPMLLTLSVHPSRRDDLETPDWLRTDPALDVHQYLDGFGNICSRVLAPAGRLALSADFIIRDTGLIDAYAPDARQHAVEDLPDEAVLFLLGSRYCETDRLSDVAWSLFGNTPPRLGAGAGDRRLRAQPHRLRLRQRRGRTRPPTTPGWKRPGSAATMPTWPSTFCRCMNIPARYCTGYMGDIGVPVVGVMDFSAWFEVYLGGRWYTFDARNNMPRMGRVLIARGRDAVDVADRQHLRRRPT